MTRRKSSGSLGARITDRFLSSVERIGNALPHPATLFALFALAIIVISWLTSLFDLAVEHPGTGEMIHPVNLMSVEGFHRILREMVVNFTGFAPLGVVLVAMLGIGIAEGSGFIGAALRLLVLSSPRRILTFVIVLSGILSNTASEVGYVLLIPLAAIIFQAAGRHPRKRSKRKGAPTGRSQRTGPSRPSQESKHDGAPSGTPVRCLAVSCESQPCGQE